MQVELLKEKYNGVINTVEIGGGPGSPKGIKVGGESTLPFLFEEGAMPNPPVIALEVFDSEPFGGVSIPGVNTLCVSLQSAHPDYGSRNSDQVVNALKEIAKASGLPIIVIGSGDDDKDNDLIPKASQAMKGEKCLFGIAVQNNYKTLAATCLADGHSLIAESPIDVNIAKQLNILISDMGFDPKKIVMHPTTASLGYGMEYVYSIMERARLAAFMGDKMLSMPFILFAGREVWKVKEAKEYGEEQGVNWEIGTAVSMLQAGADIIVMRHPRAARAVTQYIDQIIKG